MKGTEEKRNRYSVEIQYCNGFFTFPMRFERTTCRLGGDRSILLSYGNTIIF